MHSKVKIKQLILFAALFLVISCKTQQPLATDQLDIANTLDNWHKAAAETLFDAYFDAMTSDAVFIGTDPTENWNKTAFQAFAKPYFDKGKAWNFTTVERHIYFSKDKQTAWFDELLDTQMKICRGSGVLIKQNGKWKIAHYVLSMTIPNDATNEVVKIKTVFDDNYLKELKSEKKQ